MIIFFINRNITFIFIIITLYNNLKVFNIYFIQPLYNKLYNLTNLNTTTQQYLVLNIIRRS